LKLLLEKVDQVAATDAAVLISGETGTGKELVARAIHGHSNRKDAPLVKVNCASLPSGLIESALFGHEKGAYTGAVTQEVGRFELADGGTIFLDEIGEIHQDLQTKLLRVLQEGAFERVGSGETRTVDLRVIAATNRDLHRAMREGPFRTDLYFRLAVFPIEVPPLRARREDIPLLVWHFISDKQAKLGKRIEQVSQTTMDRLTNYPWPGNIRELENVVERAMILSPGSTLIVEPLLQVVMPGASFPEAKPGSADDVLRNHILGVLQECHWRIKGAGAAADRLGMNPSTLRYRMKKLGIERR
jgi:formate hydrogenlyase transcriptional activator